MKAILVIDMPETCLECQFYKRIDETHFAEVYCCMALRKIMACDIYTEKDNKCPLKPMPQRKEFDNQIPYKKSGWNDCIDEILGEK